MGKWFSAWDGVKGNSLYRTICTHSVVRDMTTGNDLTGPPSSPDSGPPETKQQAGITEIMEFCPPPLMSTLLRPNLPDLSFILRRDDF